jgi:hypothetical protein
MRGKLKLRYAYKILAGKPEVIKKPKVLVYDLRSEGNTKMYVCDMVYQKRIH